MLRRRREWFEPFGDVYAVTGWIPAGHIPTLTEAGQRLDLLRREGPSPAAVTFRDPFPAARGRIRPANCQSRSVPSTACPPTLTAA
ncbi:DUF3291 domain-containing protein [Dactylosporangium roseum]|uniref:DUF3291 domain-containing protein n=1 Tax=Dactylosporangium roseum TaxID=47989 RepID=A0ABY5ZB87_9ACTN|nr:DUF3291 domain-containing protein [Dactylosporangium roseum]UWZ38263.1 DUF3291 domain-containing protein [Dactylosporangium roseum]